MELEAGLKTKIQEQIQTKDVFLFMKGNPDFPMCGFHQLQVLF